MEVWISTTGEPHLSRDGHRTLCGTKIDQPRWRFVEEVWTPDHFAGCEPCGTSFIRHYHEERA